MKLALLDTNGIAHRLYWSVPTLGHEGREQGMLYAVTKWLLGFVHAEAPPLIAACFDVPGKTWRHELSAEYKAQRKPKPPELIEQLVELPRIVSGLGVACVSVEGFEADDVIATLTKKFSHTFPVDIVSGDKDLLQLVREGGDHVCPITAIDPRDGARLGPSQVKERLGVAPDRVLDYLALVGDAADNISGVDRVGKVAARKIVNREPVSDRIRAAIEAQQEAFLLSRRLAALREDVPLNMTLKDMIYVPPTNEQLGALLGRYGFYALKQEMDNQQKEM